MKDFKRSGGFGGDRRDDRGGDRRDRGFGGGRPSFGGRGRPEMHKATCANCGKICEVPFRPNGEKPVYCNECFGGKTDASRRENNFEKRDFANRGSFNKPERQESRSGDDIKKTLEMINIKLDRLIGIMEKPHTGTPIVTTEKPSLKEMVVKAQKAAKDTKSKKGTSTKKAKKK